MWETGRDRDNLHNVIEDQRHLKTRTPTPPRRSLAGDGVPLGRGSFCGLATPLQDVRWPDKFKVGHIDKYDGSSNPEEFIQVSHTIIEAAGGDDRVKANYLPRALSDVARLWFINLPEGSIYTLD
jgi:hypothetical protein